MVASMATRTPASPARSRPPARGRTIDLDAPAPARAPARRPPAKRAPARRPPAKKKTQRPGVIGLLIRALVRALGGSWTLAGRALGGMARTYGDGARELHTAHRR